MNRLQKPLAAWRQRWRERTLLLALLAVCAVGLVITWDDTSDGWYDILYWERPLPSAAHFHEAIRDADRIVVRDGGYPCCESIRKNPILFTVTDKAEIDAVYDGIVFISFTNAMAGGCLCCGWPGIDWYKGNKRLVLTSVQHGGGIRWKGFGTTYFGPFRGYGDIPLTTESAIWLTQWMRGHGVTNDSDYSEQRVDRLKEIADKTPAPVALEAAPSASSSVR